MESNRPHQPRRLMNVQRKNSLGRSLVLANARNPMIKILFSLGTGHFTGVPITWASAVGRNLAPKCLCTFPHDMSCGLYGMVSLAESVIYKFSRCTAGAEAVPANNS
ncbi:hypothetical protein NPIL_167141 [Nephila pilipes]|uniref:Uncharacterized protein n=1 Tax=Nephila pilipes TaxID=299642 RepID=A0A8X6NNW7_NEPPI|nr:hypothetical protein NPIL_167141 [Nephila pilipes]